MLILVSTVSAADWDNTIDYKNEDKTVVITNWLGLGEKLGEATLSSHSSIVEVRKVMPGENRVVMYYDFNFNSKYNSGLGDVQFIDEKTGKDIDKDYYFAEAIFEDYEYPIEYETVCEKRCVQVPIKYEVRQRIKEWRRLDTSDIPQGEVRIGLVTDVVQGDEIDGIWKIAGRSVSRHAAWSASLEVDLLSWWKFEETSGNFTNNVNNYYDAEPTAGVVADTEGIIGSGMNISDNNNATFPVLRVGGFSQNDGNWSACGWVYTAMGAGETMPLSADGKEGHEQVLWREGNKVRFYPVDDGKADTEFSVGQQTPQNVWAHWCFVREGTTGGHLVFYENGTSQGSLARPDSQAWFNNFGDGYNGALPFSGSIDEWGIWNRSLTSSEVSDLYNGGVGITYQGTLPSVTLNAPVDNHVNSTLTMLTNCSATASSGTIANISLWTNETGSWALEEVTTGLTGTTDEAQWNHVYTADGKYLWNCEACDSNGDCDYASANRTITLDSTDPSVTITYPPLLVGYTKKGGTLDINWTVSDDNLDSCWYSYNSTNTTLTCGDTNATFNVEPLVNTITLYANDTINNIASDTSSWNYNLFENSQTYNATTTSDASEKFSINISYSDTNYSIITSNLIYNGTGYSATKIGSGSELIFEKAIGVGVVTNEQNHSFYWNFALTNASGTYYENTTTNYQIVSVINMSLCGNPYTTKFLNFSLFDENTLERINGTIELTFNYGTIGGNQAQSFSYTDATGLAQSFAFCMNPADKTYVIDSTLEYSAPGYVTKFYNFQDLVVTNQTTNTSLYLLNTGNSTSFIIFVRDSGFAPVTGAEVHVQRYDTGTGNWLTTEIVKTNYEGKALGHLLAEDVNYKFLVYQSGTLTLNSSSTKIVCEETPCTVTLTIPSTEGEAFNQFDDIDNLDKSLTWDEDSDTFTFTYSDTSSDFNNGRLEVYLFDFGNGTAQSPACNTTSTAASAVITCDISSLAFKNGTYIASGYIDRDSNSHKLVARIFGQKTSSIVENVGLDGLFWSFFLIMGIMMLGLWRPSVGIVFGIVGTILVGLLGIVQLGIISIVSLIAIGLIILWGMKSQ